MRTKRPTFSMIAVVAALTLMTGCGQESGTGAGGPTPSVTTSTEPSTTATGQPPQSAIDQSIALLAAQLGVTPDQIEVARAIEIDWRDGSIGCAKKGMVYTDAIVPGSLVELTVDGVTYAFHQAGTQPPFYCENPTEPDE